MAIIDLRSDALTQPTAAMWEAMRGAELGWALVQEDPSVNELEAYTAALSGKAAALFVPTGSMANLLALMSHTQRGDQVIMEASSHILWSEEWGFAYICGIAARAIAGERGYMNPADVAAVIGARQFSHQPQTSLICLENTHNSSGGVPLTAEQTAAIAEVAHVHGIATHLDGMRIFNACVALGQSLKAMVDSVDTVTVGLNKGLSAPAGALLCGSESFINRCRINIKRLGGQSIHQAGILAAAALVAIKTMPEQLHHDHRRAKELAHGLANLKGLQVDLAAVQTNIVMVELDPTWLSAAEYVAQLKELGIWATQYHEQMVRFVTHRHITDKNIEQVIGQSKKIMLAAQKSK